VKDFTVPKGRARGLETHTALLSVAHTESHAWCPHEISAALNGAKLMRKVSKSTEWAEVKRGGSPVPGGESRQLRGVAGGEAAPVDRASRGTRLELGGVGLTLGAVAFIQQLADTIEKKPMEHACNVVGIGVPYGGTVAQHWCEHGEVPDDFTKAADCRGKHSSWSASPFTIAFVRVSQSQFFRDVVNIWR
jgi:hypothetical protein